MQIDVFNGDADGICALIQLRLARPMSSKLVTGVKRDIQLLERVTASADDQLTVLDISLAKNCEALERVLSTGASVFYVDHHQSGVIPQHQNLKTLINTDANTCTSLLVNDYLKGQFSAWAATAAFGDNMLPSALSVCEALGLSEAQSAALKELGVCVNYNGYGESLEDLHFTPETLFKEMCAFESPFDFMAENAAVYQRLKDGYYADMAKVRGLQAEYTTDKIAVFKLPDATWSRRVSGVYGNALANEHPQRAHAVLSVNGKGSLTVSVRAPLVNKTGADELCQSFPTGGGRKAAAGINNLPESDVDRFIEKFSAQYAD